MTNENQEKKDCRGITAFLGCAKLSDASIHLGKAFREILLATQSVIDGVIESKEQKAKVEFQKGTIE